MLTPSSKSKSWPASPTIPNTPSSVVSTFKIQNNLLKISYKNNKKSLIIIKMCTVELNWNCFLWKCLKVFSARAVKRLVTYFYKTFIYWMSHSYQKDFNDFSSTLPKPNPRAEPRSNPVPKLSFPPPPPRSWMMTVWLPPPPPAG